MQEFFVESVLAAWRRLRTVLRREPPAWMEAMNTGTCFLTSVVLACPGTTLDAEISTSLSSDMLLAAFGACVLTFTILVFVLDAERLHSWTMLARSAFFIISSVIAGESTGNTNIVLVVTYIWFALWSIGGFLTLRHIEDTKH